VHERHRAPDGEVAENGRLAVQRLQLRWRQNGHGVRRLAGDQPTCARPLSNSNEDRKKTVQNNKNVLETTTNGANDPKQIHRCSAQWCEYFPTKSKTNEP
jgi:hypothetical protein